MHCMRLIVAFFLIFNLISCQQDSPRTLIIGTMSGPETELVEIAKEVAAKKYGLEIKIVEFSDYNLPNEALVDGSLDANIYQHLPYLEAAIKVRGYPIKPIGKTFVYPTGMYSQKISSLKDIKTNDIIAIPNDPSNEARALLLLEKANLIKLRLTQVPSMNDIIANPQQLNIKEMDAAQLSRVLPDVTIAIINTNFALPAGLNPGKDALYMEDKDSPYANLIVIRNDSKKKEKLMQFVKALNSPEVEKRAKILFQGAAIPAWKS